MMLIWYHPHRTIRTVSSIDSLSYRNRKKSRKSVQYHLAMMMFTNFCTNITKIRKPHFSSLGVTAFTIPLLLFHDRKVERHIPSSRQKAASLFPDFTNSLIFVTFYFAEYVLYLPLLLSFSSIDIIFLWNS